VSGSVRHAARRKEGRKAFMGSRGDWGARYRRTLQVSAVGAREAEFSFSSAEAKDRVI
jgi:hypothetical protein